MWQREDGTFDTFRLTYNTSVSTLVMMACIDYNDDEYDFYIVDAKDCDNQNAKKTPITLDSIMAEISDTPCIIRIPK